MSAVKFSEVRLTQSWKGIIHANIQILRTDTTGKQLEMYLMMMEDEMLNATGFLLPWREWRARVLSPLMGETMSSYEDRMRQSSITGLTSRRPV